MLSVSRRGFQASSDAAMSCTTCRLRGIIRGLEVARGAGRRRRRVGSGLSFSTLMLGRDIRMSMLRSASRAVSLRPKAIHAKRWFASPFRGGMSRLHEVEILEGLFVQGHISRQEWRRSVLAQAGIDAEDADVQGRVVRLREWFGNSGVPGEVLEEEERVVFGRLFGEVRSLRDGEEDGKGLLEKLVKSTRVGRERREGWEEVEFDEEEEGVGDEDEQGIERLAVEDSLYGQARVERKGEKKVGKWKSGDQRLAEDIQSAMSAGGAAEEDLAALEMREDQDEVQDAAQEDTYQRIHPLTLENRFATDPSTIEMPRLPFLDPVTTMLANTSNVHLSEAAHRVFGGPGLPYSTSTPHRGKLMQQKPISLDAYQGAMSEMDGNLFVSTLMPGMYSSTLSIMAETRKRLGTEWAENLVRKAEAGTLRILDVGGAGAGVLAVREIIRAEWERMHAESGSDSDSPMALAEADGNMGGAHISAPLGHATVLTSSDVLRKRASKLLDNTTFVPRLPDYLHAEIGGQGKFDIVVAPHSLWALREDYMRKAHVQNLWSLLSTNGGVLVLLEKGVARGFEMIAGARDMLLETRISSPGSTTRLRQIDEKAVKDGSFTPGAKFESVVWDDIKEAEEEEDAMREGNPDLSTVPKEMGMIIAPCTNHTGCPMYTQKGIVKGRREICAFAQRYHRPDFLQRIFGTKGRNHEDVEFSYLAVMRGKDLRAPVEELEEDLNELGIPSEPPPSILQGQEATDLAFAGYELPSDSATNPAPHSLSLPRAVMPPLKRQGHVIIDLCTPSGTLERWTVPRSFSKQAFRDARKLQWGDLWALGAKTRIMRNVKAKPRDLGDLDVKLLKKEKKRRVKFEGQGVPDVRSDEFGRVVSGREEAERNGKGRVKGIRDKRDKKGMGNGRKKYGKEVKEELE